MLRLNIKDGKGIWFFNSFVQIHAFKMWWSVTIEMKVKNWGEMIIFVWIHGGKAACVRKWTFANELSTSSFTRKMLGNETDLFLVVMTSGSPVNLFPCRCLLQYAKKNWSRFVAVSSHRSTQFLLCVGPNLQAHNKLKAAKMLNLKQLQLPCKTKLHLSILQKHFANSLAFKSRLTSVPVKSLNVCGRAFWERFKHWLNDR